MAFFANWRRERDELPILAVLPGLNVALAEDLLSQMSFAQVLQKGAVAVADALGLQLPEHLVRKLQDAINAKRPAVAAGPERRLYGFAGRDPDFFETQQFQPGKRRAGEDMDREIQTPPAQRCPAVVNCDRELLLTPPDRIIAPARHARQVTSAGDKDHVRCIFPEATQEIATKRYPQQSHGMREEDLQRSRYEKNEKHLRVPNSIPSLPQKRLYSQEEPEQEHFRSLEFANSHQKYHLNNLNQNQPLNSRAGLRGALVNRPLTRGSLFGSLSGDSRPLNSNFRRPAGFRNWMG